MKKSFYILIFSFFLVSVGLSQQQTYNWYFGSNAGLSFSPSGATANPLTDGMLSSPEGCSAISDSAGKLLFYSDGGTIWDRSHSVMQNGSGLNGTGTATQSSIIIPKPNNNNIYYIFTINSNSKTLSYSEINILLNSGLGAVTVKNTQLLSPVSYKLTAVHQRNGFDFWVVVHGFGNNTFYSYSVTSSGVNATPVTSSIGSVHSGSDVNAGGQMKLSPDGSYLAVALPLAQTFELFEFNNSSGSILNVWTSGYQSKTPYGIEFSPDCSKFYVSFGSDLIQYDIKAGTSGNIDSAITLIGAGTDIFYSLQLAPDGKIYIAQNNSNTLGRINNPNEYGTGSAYSAGSVQLSSRQSQKGLPAFVQSWMTKLYVPSILTICEGENAQLTSKLSRNNENAYFSWIGPLGFSSNEQNPVIKNIRKNQEGYYKVTGILGSMVFHDSTYIKVELGVKARIVPDGSTTICSGDSLILYAQPQSIQYSYNWSTGETGNKIIVRNSGRYYLTITSGGCRSVDSIDVSVVPGFTPQIFTSGPKVICEGDSMLLEAYPSSGVDSYFWSTGDTTQKIFIRKGGSYTVTINLMGCLRSATINILNLQKPNTKIKAVGPTSFCTGDSTILVAEPLDPEFSILWSTGETNDSIIVKNTGIITLEVMSRNGCSSMDSVEISSGSELKVSINSFPKSPYCEGDSILLTASPVSSGYSYLWSTGETISSIKVAKDGEYSVEVTAPVGCAGRDTIHVKFVSSPSAELNNGSSGTICKGDSLLLNPKDFQPGNRYEWSTGQFTPGIFVRNSGTYRLIVTNSNGCSDSSDFILTVNPSPVISIKPYFGATLCIGDSALLVAETDKKGYTITWSTGETGDSIVVRKTGKYFLYVENEFLCKSIDSIDIRFNPYPGLEILPGNDLVLCSGDTIPLFSKSEYARYQWNTGEKTRQILVTKSGNYSLTVFDSTGCQSSADIIVRGGENLINGLEDFDFGKIQIGSSQLQKLRFWNYGQDTVHIDSIYILRNPDIFDINGPRFNINLGFSNIVDRDLYFTPKEQGIFDDSLVIAVSSPCKESIYAKISGIGTGVIGIGMPDTSGIIGMKNFRIPMRANIKLLNQQITNLSYTAKIRFYADVFLPSLLTNGIIRNDTIINGERIISIEDANVVVTNNETVLTELTGTILLGQHKKTPIKIEEFRWDNPLIDASVRNGSLEAISVCFDGANLIEISKKMKMSISPIPVNDNINIKIENSVPGDYIIILHTIEGIELTSQQIEIDESLSGKSAEFLLPVNGYSAGIYLITLEGKYISLKNLLIKN